MDVLETSPIKVECECDLCHTPFNRERRSIKDPNYTVCEKCSYKGRYNAKTRYCKCGNKIDRPGKGHLLCNDCKITQYSKLPYIIDYNNKSVTVFVRNRKLDIVGSFLIDLVDLESVIQYRWRLVKPHGYIKGGENNNTWLHRFIMNPNNSMDVDHVNHNVLDNRKSELKVVTHKENCNNRRRHASKREEFFVNELRWVDKI